MVDLLGCIAPSTPCSSDCAVGFHGHNNLGCAVGNALAAADAGATWLDGSVRGFGAGAGNAHVWHTKSLSPRACTNQRIQMDASYVVKCPS